ncbi:hypothetical protein LTR53_013996 [Teratosphaeriaceae sp. CCFEE 6253]|nr:hypothetical protein LTR53_013996 [Teratosphaeriaceae sp. CCFEE 6253]
MASMSRPAGSASTTRARHSPEAFESLYQRNSAAETLQSDEALSWHSFMRCESLSQTRLHFQNQVAGFTAADEAALVDWKEDCTPHPPKPGERPEPRGKGKGKERVASGQQGAAAAGPSAGRGELTGPGGSSPAGKGKARDKGSAGEGIASPGQGGKKRRSGGGGDR